MTLQYSEALRNAQLDAIETTVGIDAVLKIFTGAMPANVATADSGTELAEMALPTDYMAAASSGSKVKAGTWEDASANATGTAGYFRIYEDDGTTCHIQGTISETGGGGDMIIQNADVNSGQAIEITAFSISAGNA